MILLTVLFDGATPWASACCQLWWGKTVMAGLSITVTHGMLILSPAWFLVVIQGNLLEPSNKGLQPQGLRHAGAPIGRNEPGCLVSMCCFRAFYVAINVILLNCKGCIQADTQYGAGIIFRSQ